MLLMGRALKIVAHQHRIVELDVGQEVVACLIPVLASVLTAMKVHSVRIVPQVTTKLEELV